MVLCDGIPAERKFCVTYLGVQLDKNINGSVHAGNLMKAVCLIYIDMPHIWIKNVAIHFALLSSSLTLTTAVVHGIVAFVALKERLNIIQRKMVRFVNGFELLIVVAM